MRHEPAIAGPNRELRRLQDELVTARKERDAAMEALRPIRARVPRNEIDPSAQVASWSTPHAPAFPA